VNDQHATLPNPHLSIFRPYSFNPKHEDQLTRAALIVMKLVGRAHDEFLALANCSALSTLPSPRYDLQTEDLVPPNATGTASTIKKLVSVFLTPDEQVQGFDQVDSSDRRARYDGVIQYGSELLVVIESKLFSGVSHFQAQNINLKGAKFKNRRPISIRWHELLNRWWDLKDTADVDPAESEILEDFFDYAETNFGDLLPFTDLGRCGGNRTRRLRRLQSILLEATGITPEIQAGGTDSLTGRTYQDAVNVKFPSTVVTAADRVAMWIEQDSVCLAMWPSELSQQYRHLYRHPNRVEALITLANRQGWELNANFHIAYRFARPSQRWYPKVALSGAEYVRQWVDDVAGHAGERTRETLTQSTFRSWMLRRGYATKKDMPSLDAWLKTRPAGIKFHIRPSVQIMRRWKLKSAIAKDRDGQLGAQVKIAINQMLKALDEPNLDAVHEGWLQSLPSQA
jgi:hypothetical protein